MSETTTRVVVDSKSVGCSLNSVFKRSGPHYPKGVPFYGWIRSGELNMNGQKTYTIMYNEFGDGGDYYLRRDFEFDECEMFSDKDFEL
jgi:hypothetical protein